MAIVPPSPDFQALHSEREGVFHTTIEQVLRRADQVRKVLSVLSLVTPVPGSGGAGSRRSLQGVTVKTEVSVEAGATSLTAFQNIILPGKPANHQQTITNGLML